MNHTKDTFILKVFVTPTIHITYKEWLGMSSDCACRGVWGETGSAVWGESWRRWAQTDGAREACSGSLISTE